MPDAAADTGARARIAGAASRPRCLLGRSAIAGTAAVLIAAGVTAPLLPPGCGIGWTMIGHTLIYVPDCTHPSPSPAPPPDGGPPPDAGPPPGQ